MVRMCMLPLVASAVAVASWRCRGARSAGPIRSIPQYRFCETEAAGP